MGAGDKSRSRIIVLPEQALRPESMPQPPDSVTEPVVSGLVGLEENLGPKAS